MPAWLQYILYAATAVLGIVIPALAGRWWMWIPGLIVTFISLVVLWFGWEWSRGYNPFL